MDRRPVSDGHVQECRGETAAVGKGKTKAGVGRGQDYGCPFMSSSLASDMESKTPTNWWTKEPLPELASVVSQINDASLQSDDVVLA